MQERARNWEGWCIFTCAPARGSETQCTPTPRARKNGPFLGSTAKREIFLTVRIPPETKVVGSIFNVKLASKGCASRPASYLPVSDETMLNDHLYILRTTFPANFPPSKGVCLTSYFSQMRKGLPSCLSTSWPDIFESTRHFFLVTLFCQKKSLQKTTSRLKLARIL